MTTIRLSMKPTKREREDLAGSAATGLNGAANRVFTLTTTKSVTIKEVFLDGLLLNPPATSYSIDNANKQVTALVNVFNNQNLSVIFEV